MTRNGKTPKKTPGRKNNASKLKDPVEVYCRLRPLGDFDDQSCVEVLDDATVQLNQPENPKFSSNRIESLQCKFKHVFKEFTPQEEIFNRIGLPLTNDLLHGKSGLMFMYGITGSGKTHTMNGIPSDGGLLPRCLDTLFNSIGHLQANRCVFKPDGYNGFDLLTSFEAKQEWARQEREVLCQTPCSTPRQNRRDNIADVVRIPDTTQLDVDEDNNYSVFISYVEIYNNFIYDLLEETTSDSIVPKAAVSKTLREDSNRNMFVYGVTEVEVKSTEEAYEMFWKGQGKRRVAHTQLNAESSRSHSVFTIRLVQAPLDSQGENLIQDRSLVAVSQLSLCDLAGSERTSRTQSDGDRLREAGNINSSLMTLRSCIESLRENQKAIESGGMPRIVPYRDAKLTLFFKNFFDGDGKVRMIVCLNPRADDFDESIHVVRFAELTQEVRVARSDDVKFETGLTPGRGKANRLYKNALRAYSESETTDGYTDSDAQPDIIKPLETFNPFPPFKVNLCNDDTTLPNLINYLVGRAKKRESLIRELVQLQETLRLQLVDGYEVNANAAQELQSVKSVLSEKEREIITLEKRFRSVNQKTSQLQSSVAALENEKRALLNDADRFKKLAEKERQEKMRLKQTLKDLTSNERLRWERECDKRVKEKELEMGGVIYQKSAKLRQLCEIVQGLDSPARSKIAAMDVQFDAEEAPPVTAETHRSAPKKETPAPAVKPPRIRSKTAATPKMRCRSPPPSSSSSNKKANNPREMPIRTKGHRRSRSSDYWIEHKPKTTLSTDTILQPILMNKKTVNVPDMGDLKKNKRYLLTHQEQDSSGEIETRLIKGDVMKTRGGGHSVQFTDVETLKKRFEEKQKKASKMRAGRKRTSEESASSEDSWTSVETRCAVGIEGKPGNNEASVRHIAKKPKS